MNIQLNGQIIPKKQGSKYYVDIGFSLKEGNGNRTHYTLEEVPISLQGYEALMEEVQRSGLDNPTINLTGTLITKLTESIKLPDTRVRIIDRSPTAD